MHNSIRAVKQDQGRKIEIEIKLETYLQTEKERRSFYKNFNRNEKTEQISLGHRKINIIYLACIFINLVVIHLLSEFSEKLDQKYPTDGYQQNFSPAPGSCLAY